MSAGSPPSVLIVDDESELVDLYATLLEDRYPVTTATSGEEALEAVDESIDIGLLDRRMPDLSGDEVLAEIRSRGYDIQVAMLTAVEPDVDIVDMPFDDYKTKPVDREDLVGVIEVLSERAAYDEQSQEFFRLASKKASLEVADKEHTAEYETIVDEMAAVRSDIDGTLDGIAAESAFADL